jgi:S-disulfanyl-L-cysteine oxidoreductase SoxD
MTTRFVQSLYIAGAALIVATSIAALDARAFQTKNASEGVYTAAQATRGRDLYDSSCASCHELSKFRGAEFSKAWTDKPATELHTALVSMPMDAPGSMKPQEYADILAYFLSLNGYPAGQAELAGDEAAIKALKIDVKK